MNTFPSTLFSFTPGFSPVERHFTFDQGLAPITGLKAGANKRES
jgi:hypothetical protein